MTDDTQISDTHIVSVAGHGIDPSPVPPEPEGDLPSGSRMFKRKNRKGKHFAHSKRAKNDRLTLRDAITWFGIPVLVVILIRVFLFGAYTIPSGSMLDTIHIGDYVITTKLTPRLFPLKRGDIVVFEDPAHW